MNNTIYSEKEFKIGSDFELHSFKKMPKKRQTLKVSENGDSFLPFENKGEGVKKDVLHGLQYTNLGISVLIPILLGVVIGSYLDSFYKSRPIATLIFLLFGVISSFYNLFHELKKR